jgi:hypothetical protein
VRAATATDRPRARSISETKNNELGLAIFDGKINFIVSAFF